MELELWWLIGLPIIFFGLGWLAARIDIKQLLTESRALPTSLRRSNVRRRAWSRGWPPFPASPSPPPASSPT